VGHASGTTGVGIGQPPPPAASPSLNLFEDGEDAAPPAPALVEKTADELKAQRKEEMKAEALQDAKARNPNLNPN
jgi:cell division septal protein FtsQ